MYITLQFKDTIIGNEYFLNYDENCSFKNVFTQLKYLLNRNIELYYCGNKLSANDSIKNIHNEIYIL